MSDGIAIVIAVTQQEWASRLTAWVTDHGGAARLRDHFLFTREEALGQDYDCLISDADSSLLDAALVQQLHRLGRTVIGVCYPRLPATRARLEELGVDRVVDNTTSPQEMLRVITDVASTRQDFAAVVDGLGDLAATDSASDPGQPLGDRLGVDATDVQSCLTVVTGALEGQGATEVAIEIAVQLRRRNETVTLVDADLIAPNLAQRLRLRWGANLNTAVDAVVHHSGELKDALTASATGGFDVLAGFEHPKKWSDLDPGDLLAVIDELSHIRRHVVVNVGSQLEDLPGGRHGVARAMVSAADRIVVVADSSPAGAQRLTRWLVDAGQLTDLTRIHVVFNRSRCRDHARQLEHELYRCATVAGVWHLPDDHKVPAAAWAGEVTSPGRFTRAVATLVDKALPHTVDATPVSRFRFVRR